MSVGFLRPDHGLDPNLVFEYVSAPYVPYLVDEFTFTAPVHGGRSQGGEHRGPHSDVIRAQHAAVVRDPRSGRVGVSALLGKLEAKGPWRGILDEYRHKARPRPSWVVSKHSGAPVGPRPRLLVLVLIAVATR